VRDCTSAPAKLYTPGKMRNRLKSFTQEFQREVTVYRGVIRDPRTPRLARWILAAAVAYALSPIDLIPDFIPVLGHVDDLIILPILVGLAIRLVPNEVVLEHRRRIGRKSETG